MNKELRARIANILENGTQGQRDIVLRCLDNDDTWGLEWVLKNMEEGL